MEVTGTDDSPAQEKPTYTDNKVSAFESHCDAYI